MLPIDVNLDPYGDEHMTATVSTQQTQPQTAADVRKAISLINTGRAMLAKQLGTSFGNLTPEQLDVLMEVAGGGVVEDIALPEEVDTAPKTSNVERLGIGRRAQIIDGKRPALTHAIAIVLRDKKEAMNADQVFKELETCGWLPTKVKNARHTVGHTLSVNRELFPRVARGLYTLAEGVEIPTKIAPQSAAGNSEQEPVESKKRKINTGPRVLKVLDKSKGPISITDLTKASKIGHANYKSVTAFVMTLLKKGVVKKVADKNAEGQSLFEVDREAFDAYSKSLS